MQWPGYVAIDGDRTADMSEKVLTTYRRKHLGLCVPNV